MKDLNKLSKEIYEANKAKGFHDEKHSVEHMMCLVISELMEAVEADRKDIHADLESFEQFMSGVKDKHYDKMYSECFKQLIKDTVSDELADAVIRLLDTAGALEVGLKRYIDTEQVIEVNSQNINNKLFAELIFSICGILHSNKMTTDTRIRVAIEAIEALCENRSIDLWKHVELKLKYNSLRPYKHGKAY